MGPACGEERAALNDLGHSPLPFLFQSLRELDQVVSRALLALRVCETLQRADGVERRRDVSCVHVCMHTQIQTQVCLPGIQGVKD